MSTEAKAGETDPQRFIGVRQGARRAGVSRRVLRRWIVDGRLRSYRPNAGGRVLVEVAELDQVILKSERIPIKTDALERPVVIFIDAPTCREEERGGETRRTSE